MGFWLASIAWSDGRMKHEYLFGCDEAGLGPVFGPLVVAGAVIDLRYLSNLKDLGVKDSKLFGHGKQARMKRKSVWSSSRSYIKFYKYEVIHAGNLDESLLSGKNMYVLEIGAIARIIKAAKRKKIRMKTICIHQLGCLSKANFLRIMKAYVDLSFEEINSIIYEVKADSKYAQVSMASIIAKVTRDSLVENLCKQIGQAYVSGYPNRPTADFLRKYFEKYNTLPPNVRKTRNWEPLQKLTTEYSMR